MTTPSDWFRNGVATDCLWYDEYQGNESCAKYGCTLGLTDDSPCILCKDYRLFERGHYERQLIRQALLNEYNFRADNRGQYRIDGVFEESE